MAIETTATKNTFTSKTFLTAIALVGWNTVVAPRFPHLEGWLSAEKIDAFINLAGLIGIGVFRNQATAKTSFISKGGL